MNKLMFDIASMMDNELSLFTMFRIKIQPSAHSAIQPMRLFEGTPFDIPPTCNQCNLPETSCVCPDEMKARVPPEKQTARLTIEKRRKGKVVTVISGLRLINNDLPQVLKQLKSACGAGGTIDGDTIEIQGEHIPKVRQELSKIGYRIK